MLSERNKYMIERYKELFEAVNPFEHGMLKNAGLLENHYSNIEHEFYLTMLEIDSDEPVEIRYETSSRINGEMINSSENQTFFENLERFMDYYQLDAMEEKILNELSIEIPGAATASFPWQEVKLFAERLQPKVYDISSKKWQEAFDLYLVERISSESFRKGYEEYFDCKL